MASQSLIDPSWLHEARVIPSLVKARSLTCCWCPVRFINSCRVTTSHKWIVRETPAAAISAPSGENLVRAARRRRNGSSLGWPRGRVPEREMSDLVGRGQERSGRRKGEGGELRRAVESGSMCPRGEVPEADRSVVAARSQEPPVRGERHLPDDVGVTREDRLPLPGGGVPDPHGMVVAGRGQPSAVRAISDRANALSVAAQGLEQVAGRDVPDSDPLLATERSGGERSPVG